MVHSGLTKFVLFTLVLVIGICEPSYAYTPSYEKVQKLKIQYNLRLSNGLKSFLEMRSWTDWSVRNLRRLDAGMDISADSPVSCGSFGTFLQRYSRFIETIDFELKLGSVNAPFNFLGDEPGAFEKRFEEVYSEVWHFTESAIALISLKPNLSNEARQLRRLKVSIQRAESVFGGAYTQFSHFPLAYQSGIAYKLAGCWLDFGDYNSLVGILIQKNRKNHTKYNLAVSRAVSSIKEATISLSELAEKRFSELEEEGRLWESNKLKIDVLYAFNSDNLRLIRSKNAAIESLAARTDVLADELAQLTGNGVSLTSSEINNLQAQIEALRRPGNTEKCISDMLGGQRVGLTILHASRGWTVAWGACPMYGNYGSCIQARGHANYDGDCTARTRETWIGFLHNEKMQRESKRLNIEARKRRILQSQASTRAKIAALKEKISSQMEEIRKFRSEISSLSQSIKDNSSEIFELRYRLSNLQTPNQIENKISRIKARIETLKTRAGTF
jgi:uncharacterized protein YdcH (DUF465 family)